MSATREFFAIWLQENVGGLPAEGEVSVAVLAQQFEQDADAAGCGREIRDDEIGNVEDAIEKALKKGGMPAVTKVPSEDSSLAPVMEALEVVEAESGP
jgi:hypothetical protein